MQGLCRQSWRLCGRRRRGALETGIAARRTASRAGQRAEPQRSRGCHRQGRLPASAACSGLMRSSLAAKQLDLIDHFLSSLTTLQITVHREADDGPADRREPIASDWYRLHRQCKAARGDVLRGLRSTSTASAEHNNGGPWARAMSQVRQGAPGMHHRGRHEPSPWQIGQCIPTFSLPTKTLSHSYRVFGLL